MLRLQLLPDQVFEGARIRKATIVCVLIFLIDAVVCFLWFSSTKTAMNSMAQQAEVASGYQSQINALDGEIGALQAQIAPVDSKHDYVLALKDYGDQWTGKMRELSKFIYARVEVLNAQLDAEGFELEVRTKTTEDVARLLMNLKAGYTAGLIQTDSLNVTGLTGWPNMTSPWGYGLDEVMHMEIGVERGSFNLVDVNSQSDALAEVRNQGRGGGDAGMEGSGGEVPSDEAASSSEMSGEPGFEGGGGGGAGARASQVQSDRMRLMAIAKYIEPSVDKPPQPYLNLTIQGRWQQPLTEPTGNAPAGAAPAAGAVGEMPGDPGMSEAPPMDEAPAPE